MAYIIYIYSWLAYLISWLKGRKASWLIAHSARVSSCLDQKYRDSNRPSGQRERSNIMILSYFYILFVSRAPTYFYRKWRFLQITWSRSCFESSSWFITKKKLKAKRFRYNHQFQKNKHRLIAGERNGRYCCKNSPSPILTSHCLLHVAMVVGAGGEILVALWIVLASTTSNVLMMEIMGTHYARETSLLKIYMTRSWVKCLNRMWEIGNGHYRAVQCQDLQLADLATQTDEETKRASWLWGRINL